MNNSEERHWHCVFCKEAVYLGKDSVRKQETTPLKTTEFKYAHGACVVWDAGWMNQVRNP